MKTFKEILLEIRSKERAIKLLDYIHRKQTSKAKNPSWDMLNNLLPRKNIDVGLDGSPGYMYTHRAFENDEHPAYKHRKIMSVPLNKVSSAQKQVTVDDLKSKIRGGSSRHDPKIPYYVHDSEKDIFHLVDGNHRTNSRKLRDFGHVKAVVIDSKHLHMNEEVLDEKAYTPDTPYKPYKRKNPKIQGKKRVTTRGLVNNTKLGSHAVRVAATENPQRKNHYNFSVTVNGRRQPTENSKAHQAVHAKHAIRRLSNFLQAHNPSSVKIANMHVGDPKRMAMVAKVLAIKHGYELRSKKNSKGVDTYSLHRKHSW